MNAEIELDIKELKEFLLAIAPNRPVFIWGPPGIGKSSVVEQFCKELSLECVPLMGSQLAPEDLIGIPQIDGKVSRFVPPSMIVRETGYCLFIDELNTASSEVQKAFYSLILDKRIGEYKLPHDSIVIGAGNRAADSALVKQMPSALVNRMVHIHLKVNSRLWLNWAANNGVHPWIIEYIQSRPSHLSTKIAPTDESPFSTPRSWQYVSDGLHELVKDENYNSQLLEALLYGTLTKEHAMSFQAFIKQIKYKYNIEKIIKGNEKWPAEDRGVLLFLVEGMKDYLHKQLPKNQDNITSAKKQLVIQIKDTLKSLSNIDNEYAQIILSPTELGEQLPAWFLIEITKELPKLTSYEKK